MGFNREDLNKTLNSFLNYKIRVTTQKKEVDEKIKAVKTLVEILKERGISPDEIKEIALKNIENEKKADDVFSILEETINKQIEICKNQIEKDDSSLNNERKENETTSIKANYKKIINSLDNMINDMDIQIRQIDIWISQINHSLKNSQEVTKEKEKKRETTKEKKQETTKEEATEIEIALPFK